MSTQKLVQKFNDFLIVSSNLLDSFCSKFESQIFSLEIKIDSIERHLLLLEHKLADVPCSGETSMFSIGNKSEKGSTSIDFDEVNVSENQFFEKEESVKDDCNYGLEYKDHPKFGKYFRMLKMVNFCLYVLHSDF